MSTRQDTIQTTFAGGEVDAMVHSRSDTKAYLGASAICLNVIPVNQGGLRRRPGTYHVADIDPNTWIWGFNFSDDQRFVIAVAAASIKVWTTTGVLAATLTTATFPDATTQPLSFSSDVLRELHMTAAGDSILITHHTMRPLLLRRTIAGTWELMIHQLFVWAGINQWPWHKFADAEVTLTPSHLNTGATLTSTVDHFTADHVGYPIRYRGVTLTITAFTDAKHVVISSPVNLPHDETGVVAWAATTAYAVGQIVRTPTGGLLYKCVTAGTSAASEPTGTGTAIVDGTAAWDYVALKGTTDWSEAAWSGMRGWPRTAVFHEQRLWFAGTTQLPNGLWASHVGDYFNFNVGTGLDDEAIGVIVVTDRIPHIRHLQSARYLEVYTSIGEWYVPSSEGVPITPGNVAVKHQTPYGCSPYASPCHLDGATLFVDRTGRAVREFKLDGGSVVSAYSAESVSLLAPHLIRVPVAMDVQYGTPERAEQLAFVVNEDGSMSLFHSIRSEKVAGWYRWSTPEGYWRDVAAAGDDVFFVVERGGNWTLELLAASQDELCLDCAKTVAEGGSPGSYSGLAHLAAELVHVTAEGWYLGIYAVSATGTLQLDEGLTFPEVSVGYDYGIRIKTLPVVNETRSGPQGSSVKRIVQAIIRVEETASLSVGPYPIITRYVSDDFSLPPNPASGPFRIFQGGYDRLGQIDITQEAPLPCSIQSLQLKVAF